jgi:hypothetical protein
VDQPAEPAQQQSEPKAAPAPKTPPAAPSAGWLTALVFSVVAIPAFLFLFLYSARKGQNQDRKPAEASAQGPARPKQEPNTAPPAGTAIANTLPPQETNPPREGIVTGLPPQPSRPAPETPAEKEPPAEPPRRHYIAKPSWRAYYHVTCKEVTIVSGDDYVLLECPFRPVNGTYCSHCRDFVGLNEVRWVDSDEKISDYRDRVRNSVPFWRQVWLSVFCNAYQGAINWGVEWKGDFDERDVRRPNPRVEKGP